MVYRVSWIAGVAGIGLALARATRLLRPSTDGLAWQLILIAAVALGAAITWAAVGYRLRGLSIFAINVVALAITVVRVAVPETTWYVFPTLDSFRALGTEIAFARDVIRTGVAPVIPLAGIIAILTIVYWGMGALLTWGLRVGRPYVAVLTPLVVYLEFSVMDRRPSGWWTTAFMAIIGLALIAVAVDRRRDGTGLLVSTYTRRALIRSLPSIGIVTLSITLVIALFTADAMAGLVPRTGILEWRNSSSLSGEYYGSISYNPFVGIRQQLISQTNVPVFVAEVEGDLQPGEVYWRLVTLDSFDGAQWHIGGRPEVLRPEEADTFERPEYAFAGDTASVTADVTVLALQQDWLPAPYSPVAFDAVNNAVARGYRVKEDDGSLRFDALTYRGMVYTVAAEVPIPDLDVLSRTVTGGLSVVFRGAIEGDAFEADASTGPIETRQLEDRTRFVDLPEGIDPGVRTLARSLTENLETDYERALALEAFFRTPGNFRYSTSILPGHGATDLSAWLLDAESPNFRVGYCEQFSTSMAVMARMLGIPSRVVLGFTPGTLLDDGRVVVRDRNAHAWVELWMPSQGWVRFDPTPRGDGTNPSTTAGLPFDIAPYLDVPAPERPAIDDTNTQEPVLLRDEPDVPRVAVTGGGDETTTSPGLPGWLVPALLAALALFGLIPAMKWVRRRRRLRRLSDGDVAAAWSEIVDRLSDLGDAPSASRTPHEVARATDPAMRPLADVYAESVYGPGGLAPSRVAIASRALEDTEERLLSRYSLPRRIASQYSLTSLVPEGWRRLRRSRRI